MKKNIRKNRDKEYNTQTLPTSVDGLSKLEHQAAEDAITRIYEPRPLTPDDDIYENIIEQFASAPTKPKYWFEEFGDYWSCSCGHINKGAICKSCGLERELLRSLFILHKPADAPGKLNKKLKKAKAQVDQEEELQAERERRRMEREASGEDMIVVPIARSIEPEDEQESETPALFEDITSEPSAEEHDEQLSEGTVQEHEAEEITEEITEETGKAENAAEAAETLQETEAPEDAEFTPDEETGKITQNDEEDILLESDPAQYTVELPQEDYTENVPVENAEVPQTLETHSGENECALHDQDHSPDKKNLALLIDPPSDIKAAETPGDKKKKNRFKLKIIIAILVCFAFVVAGGITIYVKMAAPAIQYQEAQQLQEEGKYQKAIEKYEALGDYKDAQSLIWECWIGIGDKQYDDGLYSEAIETYEYVLANTENEDMNSRIRQCHIAIGDKYLEDDEYENALASYAIAMEMEGSEELQDKINDVKFAYVKAYKDDRTTQVEKYMDELRGLDYEGIQEIYDEYYAWHVKIVTNTLEDDYSTDVETVSRKDTVYFHTSLSGGEPDETIQVYYEVIWPNDHSEIYNIESSWKDGSKITARFQYSMPLFGQEGKLTFKLYDISTHELLGSDSVTFKN